MYFSCLFPSIVLSLPFSSSSLIHYHVPKLLDIFIEKLHDDNNNTNKDFLKYIMNRYSECISRFPSNFLKLLLDPEILTYQILQTLVVKGFQLECDFFLYYLNPCYNQTSSWSSLKFLAIKNEQDLKQAIRSCLSDNHPHLHLIVDSVDYCQLLRMSLEDKKQQQIKENRGKKNKKNENEVNNYQMVVDDRETKSLKYKILSEWDIVTNSDIILAQTLTKTNNFILNQIEKLKTKARYLNELSSKSAMLTTNSWLLAEAIYQYIMSDDCKQEPITDIWPYLDSDGRVRSHRDFRVAIYRRGMDPTLRRIGWKHLLNVYPEDYTGQERLDFIRNRCETYRQMRELWQRNRRIDPEVVNVCNMVRKDVRRTDRHHAFYTSPEDPEFYGDDFDDDDPDSFTDQQKHLTINPNVTSLFNILVTYALNHKYRYCQGMSDLASPLLYVMKDEAHAYITFCALMQRLGENFSTDSEAISRKFRNLKLLLQHYDLEFYRYLQKENAEELLFSYRWILLDLKREFPFDDVLEMLEVLWASIPPPHHQNNQNSSSSTSNLMNLFDLDFLYVPNHNSSNENGQTNKKAESDIKQVEFESSKPLDLQEKASSSIAIIKKSTTTSSSQVTESLSKRKEIKFLPNMLSIDSQSVMTTSTLDDSPIFEDSKVQWSSDKIELEVRPRPWDSPNLVHKNNREFRFDKMSTLSDSFPTNVDSSRLYVDSSYCYVGDDSFSASGSAVESSSGSSSYDGDGEDEDSMNRKPQQQQKPEKVAVEKKNYDNVSCSTCSTFDSGIQRSNTTKSYQDDFTYSFKKDISKFAKINHRISSSHCNGDNCSDDEVDDPEKIDIFSNFSTDHGYMTDYQQKHYQPEMEIFMTKVFSQSTTSKKHHKNDCPPLTKAKQLLNFFNHDEFSSSKSIDSLKTIMTNSITSLTDDNHEKLYPVSPSQITEVQIDESINEQFNDLSAKSVSEEMLNCAIKQMETLQIQNSFVDPPDSSNRSSCSSSSIELLSAPDEVLGLTENTSSKQEIEEFPLISPEQLGPNDAFMLFVCLTLLLQNRDYIIQKRMDRNDIQMYFDSMVRKHDVRSVLQDARHLFHTYLSQWRRSEQHD